MSNKDSESPGILGYASAAIGVICVIYLIITFFTNSRANSPLIDAIMLLAALAFGFLVMFVSSRLLFRNGDESIDKANIAWARAKIGLVICLSMVASGSVAFIYFFII